MRPPSRSPWRIRARAALAGAWPRLREPDRGAGGHDDYFSGISAALKRAGIAEPTLVIDKARLAANIAWVREALAPAGLALRAVTKSLPAPALLSQVLDGAGTDRMMIFNGVMLEEIAAFRPGGDVLLGRPLPAVQAGAFVRAHLGDPAPATKPQWLIDSTRRLSQYVEIARETGERLRMNFEIDVGLHRGGFPDEAALAGAVDRALAEPLIEIAGLMGYDPHAVGAASPAAEIARVKARYVKAKDLLAAKLGRDPASLTLDAAGSPTFALHLDGTPANEVAIGSAFVKPRHFDLPTLKALAPAAFIAQPVLKVMDPALIPGLEPLSPALSRIDPNSARGFFLYGGYGDARPVSPPGLRFSALYGGRAMLTGSAEVALDQDDFVFLRPTESEGVLLQFGDLAVYQDGEITERWPTFRISA
jgi:D-serine deaminase-like pyridoxal phosphate-dependent protein